jgi:hypothetical protein
MATTCPAISQAYRLLRIALTIRPLARFDFSRKTDSLPSVSTL